MTRAEIDAEELAALRAENGRLFNGLKAVMEEMNRIWDEFEIGDELPRSLGMHILNSTTPDPLYASAPKMLEALKFCRSVMVSNGIFERSEQLALEMADEAIARAKGETA